MMDIFNEVNAWLALGGLSLAGLIAIAWFFPPFRRLAIEIAAAIAAGMAIYAKGAHDAKRNEKAKQDAAVKRAEEKFDKIDARPDSPDSVDRRLRNGNF